MCRWPVAHEFIIYITTLAGTVITTGTKGTSGEQSKLFKLYLITN